MLLEQKISFQPKKRFLVFSSVGDQARIKLWTKGVGRKEFDLVVFYYGDAEPEYLSEVDFAYRRKGSKFQNLKAFYEATKSLSHYESVMVLDDDIEIDSPRLVTLFKLRRDLDLWVLQPSFSADGKISFEHTRQDPAYRYRFTNFVEMNCPLFSSDKLIKFLEVYDGVLPGWGMDWWYHNIIGGSDQKKIAIIDEVVVRNPFDQEKRGGKREINQLVNTADRIELWQQCMKKYGCKEFKPELYGGEDRSFDLFRLGFVLVAFFRWLKRKKVKGF
ncbi:hypothetical protein [Agaribacterium sp. ZY112]|uniref:hypothetical protein n=1 Tax=Agaribacterium sp. ZY112 TaxID=3233574 RepID=UPI0035257DC0